MATETKKTDETRKTGPPEAKRRTHSSMRATFWKYLDKLKELDDLETKVKAVKFELDKYEKEVPDLAHMRGHHKKFSSSKAYDVKFAEEVTVTFAKDEQEAIDKVFPAKKSEQPAKKSKTDQL